MRVWSMERKIRWGFAATALALLLVLGVTYVVIQTQVMKVMG